MPDRSPAPAAAAVRLARSPRAGRGRLSFPSVTQTLPSRSTWMPCGKTIMPAPKLFTSLPVASNLSTGSSGDILPVAVGAAVRAAALADPDRLAVLVDVHRARRAPLAALGQLEVVVHRLYGFGASFTGGAPGPVRNARCADANAADHESALQASCSYVNFSTLCLYFLTYRFNALRPDFRAVDVAGASTATPSAALVPAKCRRRSRFRIGNEAR